LAEGDFSHRIAWTSRDELGQLIDAFNEMALKLQSTTVSRGYLQSIVNSMGDALFVVSRSGIIQMANPAAEQLLGYQQGELAARSLISIAGLDSAAARACDVRLPTRLTDQLIHREGIAIPVSISAVPLPLRTGADDAVVCIAQDLRERLEADRRQRQAAVVFENTKEGIILTDAHHAIVLANPALSQITGYEIDEAVGMAVPQLWSNREDGPLTETVWATVQEHGQWQGEIWMRRKDGEIRPVWKNISAVHDASGHIANFVLVFSDISAIKAAEERLNYLAYYDALTDLPNRQLLAERVRLAIDRAQRAQTSGRTALFGP
jgi:PAS domain S-box-containing protein